MPNDAPGKKFEQEADWGARYGTLQDHGTAFEGTEGWVHVDRSRISVKPEALIDVNPAEFKLRLSQSSDHVGNFLESIKTRQPTVCPIDDAVLSDAFCHVANIAVRLKRKLTYDTRAEKFLDSPNANQRLSLRPMRAPWSVEA